MLLDAQDTAYLERALTLAEKGRGCTSPNPVVGAVIVVDGRVVGEGYHAGPWRDHAEIAAMKDADTRAGAVPGSVTRAAAGPAPVTGTTVGPGAPAEAATNPSRDSLACTVCRGATMYVTLEPCCNYGRTPPCTSALIAAGFARVVVGAIDPSPNVNGRGLDQLREAGIRVDLADGALALRIKRQNDGHRKWVVTGLPFVTYKYAMTLDGRVATDTGHSRWISGPESRRLVHQLRSWSDAVLVGAGTVATDDPRLTAREPGCDRQPLRVVLDGRLALPKEAALVQSLGDGPVLAICGTDVPGERRAEVESWGVETAAVHHGDDGGLDPGEVIGLLGARGVQTALLEGGPRVAGAWWSAGAIDRVLAFISPQFVLGRENRSPLCGAGVVSMDRATTLREVDVRSVGADLLISGYLGEAF